MSLPLEFRFAIGASGLHDQFDGTLILSLCYRDPGMSVDTVRQGNLALANVRDDIVPDFAIRYGNSPDNPRRLYSTGYGARIAWDVDLRVRTSRVGILPTDVDPRPEINDGSLWHLASIIAMDRAITDFEPPAPFPPYLWVTASYQCYDEQWFAVEVDPANATAGPITFNPETKTAERTLHLRLVTRDPYRVILPDYVPSYDVFDLPGVIVTAMPETTPGTGPLTGAYVTQLTLSEPLPLSTPQAPDGVGLMDNLLVNLAASRYGWKLFTIQDMDGERKVIDVSSLTPLSGAFQIPPSPACDAVRGVVQSRNVYRPRYCVIPFTGTAPPRAQLPLVSAKLIGGGFGCPPI